MTKIRLKCVVFLFIIGLILSAVCAAAEPWEKIQAEPISIDFNGQSRQLEPGCAFAPPHPFASDYSFFFKAGKPGKVAILFNGGGACWNSETCLQSLQIPDSPPPYVPSADLPHNDVENWGGLLDEGNPENPYGDWSILFLPYCTGDVHIGSNDQYYGPEESTPVIRHRGFDNFLYAREWLRQRYADRGERVAKVLVAGSSAGAYGAAFNFPYIKQIFPDAKGFLLADSGNGVFVDSFIDAAMHREAASWQVDANLPAWVPGIESLPSQTAATYIVSLYSSLANYYPRDRFGSYTSAWDAVQVMFYNIMLNPTEIVKWSDPQELQTAYQQWPAQMQTFAYQLAALDNYRFYIASGCEHTLLRDDTFYSTNELDGVKFIDWIQGLTGKGNFKKDWRNLICSDCPPPAAEEIGACLGQ